MNRRNKINFNRRRSSIEGCFTGAPRSDNRSDATPTSIESQEDMSRVKRVRFQESKADHHPNAKAGATSISSEAATGARSNAPKTSEFAFFKKIKEKACNHSYQLSKEGGQVKDVISRESKGEIPFMFEQSRGYLRSSLHVEKARPLNQQHHFPPPLVDTSKGSAFNHVESSCKNIGPSLALNKVKPGRHDCYSPSLGGRSRNSAMHNQEIFEQSRSYLKSSLHVENDRSLNQQQHFHSPLVDASKGSGRNHVETTCKNITPPLSLNKVEPGMHDCYTTSLGGRSRNSGNQCSDKGVFSAKRQKLRQLVADTTLLEVDEPCSKGSNLVSLLLSRLFPENTESKLCQSAKSREVQNDIQQQQTVFPNSGMYVKRLCKTPTMNLNAKANWAYFDDARAKARSSSDISRVTPELDIICSDSPSTSYAARASTEYPYIRNLRNEHHKRITSFSRENDSSFPESYEGYDFTPSGHQYLLDYNDPDSRVQPLNHLLTWHDKSETYERNIAASSFNREVQSDIQQQQTVFPNSGMYVKRLCKTPTINLNATANWAYFDDTRAKARSSSDISRVTPELDIICSDSPSTGYAARASTEYPYIRNLRNEHHKRINSFSRENDSSFPESFEGYDFTPFGHQYLLDYNETESRGQPLNHLLTWHEKSENYERNIAASSFNRDMNTFPMSETSCSVDDVLDVHNELICLAPLFSENTLNFRTLPSYHSDSFHSDFQSHLGEENYQRAITFPRSPKYLKLIEDCIPENRLESSIIEHSPRDYWLEHDLSLEPSVFPTRLDFASGLKFLSMADSSEECRFTNDAFWFLFKEGLWSPPLRKDEKEDPTYGSNSLDLYEGTAGHDWSFFNFKQTRETDCSLLLNNSSWDLYERETYLTDVDDHYNEWKVKV